MLRRTKIVRCAADSMQFNFDRQMPRRPNLVLRLEDRAIPVDAAETHEILCWWNIGETSLRITNSFSSAPHLRIAESFMTKRVGEGTDIFHLTTFFVKGNTT